MQKVRTGAEPEQVSPQEDGEEQSSEIRRVEEHMARSEGLLHTHLPQELLRVTLLCADRQDIREVVQAIRQQ